MSLYDRVKSSLALWGVIVGATVATTGLATTSVGCKKSVDPAAFDGGATTVVTASAAPGEITAAETAAAVDPSASVAPLASLDAPKAVVAPKPVAAKPTGPKPIEACEKAKAICPNAGRALKVQCAAATEECTRAGGHL